MVVPPVARELRAATRPVPVLQHNRTIKVQHTYLGGATFAQTVTGNGQIIADEAMKFIHKLVWVGHRDVTIDRELAGETGWRLDFRRKK